MTDNEIIKALRSCPYQRDCVSCDIDSCNNSPNYIMKCARDLINRQQAKIKALQMDNEQLQSDIANANMNAEHALAEIEGLHKEVEYWKSETKEARADIDQAVAEATKEFAAKIKEDAEWICDDGYIERALIEYIDNFVKERVGEHNNSPIVDKQN